MDQSIRRRILCFLCDRPLGFRQRRAPGLHFRFGRAHFILARAEPFARQAKDDVRERTGQRPVKGL
jgi:hypothetical protein